MSGRSEAPGSSSAAAEDTRGAILLIEDDDGAALLIDRVLALEGYRVRRFANAFEGRDAIEAGLARYDAVVLDLNLPGGSGFDLLREIRCRSSLPVILVSVLRQPHNVEFGLELGAHDFLAKPFEPRELVRRLERLLG